MQDKQDSKNLFMIVAICNPYHARFHNHGGIPLEYNGATVVKWTFEHWRNLTIEEARKELENMIASEDNGYMHFENDDSICELYEGEMPDWYVGAGYYNDTERIFDPQTDLGYRMDTMTYRIEEMER